MLSFTDFHQLHELFTPTPKQLRTIKWEHDPDGEIVTARFVASNKKPYAVSFLFPDAAPDEIDPWDFFPNLSDEVTDAARFVEFELMDEGEYSGKQGIEGTGASSEVFGLVMTTMQQYIKRYQPPILYFQAAEMNRRSLYKALLNRFLQNMPGWKYKVKSPGKFAMYQPAKIKYNK